MKFFQDTECPLHFGFHLLPAPAEAGSHYRGDFLHNRSGHVAEPGQGRAANEEVIDMHNFFALHQEFHFAA